MKKSKFFMLSLIMVMSFGMYGCGGGDSSSPEPKPSDPIIDLPANPDLPSDGQDNPQQPDSPDLPDSGIDNPDSNPSLPSNPDGEGSGESDGGDNDGSGGDQDSSIPPSSGGDTNSGDESDNDSGSGYLDGEFLFATKVYAPKTEGLQSIQVSQYSIDNQGLIHDLRFTNSKRDEISKQSQIVEILRVLAVQDATAKAPKLSPVIQSGVWAGGGARIDDASCSNRECTYVLNIQTATFYIETDEHEYSLKISDSNQVPLARVEFKNKTLSPSGEDYFYDVSLMDQASGEYSEPVSLYYSVAPID